MNLVRSPEERDLAEELRRRGGRVTPQRLVLARAVRERARHVTAEELLAEVGERLPGLSLPTVYATLELFEGLGLVRRLAVTSGPTTWDTRADEHHHAVCGRCGAVSDLDAPAGAEAALKAARARGFAPERVELAVHGTCAECAARGAGAATGRPT
jgi:Fe2+ or Zn2+ uptake regulation protein